MSEREIRLFGDPVLKTECREVVKLDSCKQLVTDLLETCQQPGRAGVAANQIGVDLKVFSFHVDGELDYLINPEITHLSDETELMDEGCLSVPGLWKQVRRSTQVVIRGQKLDGTKVEIEAEGLLAQVFQHECDHLQGLLYLDRLETDEKKSAMAEIRSSEWFV